MPNYTEPTPEYAAQLLSFLPVRPDYDTWTNIIAAVGNTFPETTALAVLLSHFADEKPAEHTYWLRHRKQSISFASLVWYAKQYGYVPEQPQSAQQDAQRLFALFNTPNKAVPRANSTHGQHYSFSDIDRPCLLYRFASDVQEEWAAILQYDGGMTREEAEEAILSAHPNAIVSRVFRVAVNDRVKDKSRDYQALTTGFVNCVLSVEELASAIRYGCAICSSVLHEDRHGRTHRNNENWRGSELVILDIDGGMTLDECLQHELTGYALLLYTSHSHTEEQHRFRLLFDLPYFETDRERYRAVIAAMIGQYGADKNCTDEARGYFGNTKATIIIPSTGEVIQ